MSSGSQDAAIEVTIEDEGSVAKLVVPDDFDPALLDAALLSDVVRKRGIAVDSTVEAHLERIARTFRDQPGRLEEVIARSTAAVDGQDGRLEWMEGFDPNAGPGADLGDADVVDYYNQAAYVRVANGSHLATLHQPTPGQDGRDVTGRAIKAGPGRSKDVRIDPSLRLDESGRLTALVDGILEYRHGVLTVSPVFEVGGCIDFSTGNVDFDGTVIVRDGVRDRFEVKATEDIVVDGLIEAATVCCGRDFTCRRGMAAKGQGQLVVDGNALVGYLNNVQGRIKGNLTAQREMISCDLYIGGNLVCDRGTVIGGKVIVGGSVRIAALGSNAGIPTSLILDPTAQAKVEVRIQKVIHPGVCLKIGDVELKFDMALQGPVTIGRDEHQRLYFREGDGPARPLETLAKLINRAA